MCPWDTDVPIPRTSAPKYQGAQVHILMNMFMMFYHTSSYNFLVTQETKNTFPQAGQIYMLPTESGGIMQQSAGLTLT